MKRIIVVCDDKTKEYANYLRQLISANDDKGDEIVGTKDGEVDVVVWTEKQYIDNSPTITSNQHILFIGNNKTAQAEEKSMREEFHKFGMRYSWLGKRAVVAVDPVDLSKEDYEKFIEFCKEYGTEYEKQEFRLFKKKENKNTEDKKENQNADENKNYDSLIAAVGVAGAGLLLGVIGSTIAISTVGIKIASINAKIKEQQYMALITIFYLEGINKFLEN